MSDAPTEGGSQSPPTSPSAGESLVYVMRERELTRSTDREIGLRDLWIMLWDGRLMIAGVTALFAIASIFYALTQTEWYRAEVVLAPAEENPSSSLGVQLGGLAALAGVSVGGGSGVEALAILKSRDFARNFIEEFGLLQTFFADEWDAENQRWKNDDPVAWPDERDAVEYVQEKVIHVRQDRQSGLVTLAIEWIDPETAAQWADVLVLRLNQRLRERALREAESNIAYLQHQLEQSSVIAMQQTIGRLLETEMQKLMLARGNEQFAFRIIDSAEVPKRRVRPQRTLIVLVGGILGAMLSLIVVFVRRLVRAGSGADD